MSGKDLRIKSSSSFNSHVDETHHPRSLFQGRRSSFIHCSTVKYIIHNCQPRISSLGTSCLGLPTLHCSALLPRGPKVDSNQQSSISPPISVSPYPLGVGLPLPLDCGIFQIDWQRAKEEPTNLPFLAYSIGTGTGTSEPSIVLFCSLTKLRAVKGCCTSC